MSKRVKTKLGTFSNGGLDSGMAHFDEATVLEMYETMNQAKKKLRQVFRVEIKRLDNFIKDEYRVIPNEDRFIKWFEENKLYKNWKGFPQISDDDIFETAAAYLKECKAKIKQPKSTNPKIIDKNIILKNSQYSMKSLLEHFCTEVFKPKTSKKDVECVFSYPIQKPNGYLYLKQNNKEFVFLLNEMQNENIIVNHNLFGVIDKLSFFKSKGGTTLKRKHLDQAKHQLKNTPLAEETEQFLKKIIKNIKI